MTVVPTRILVVEDHPVARLGLVTVLSAHDDLVVVAEASTEREALAVLDCTAVDVAIVPLRLGGELTGIELCRDLSSRPGAPRVLVYTAFNSASDASAAYLSGADGFVHKGEQAGALLRSVRQVHAGRKVWIVGGDEDRAARTIGDRVGSSSLTTREREVLGFMLQRFTNAEIATELFLGIPTVKSHVSSILHKLGLTRRSQLF